MGTIARGEHAEAAALAAFTKAGVSVLLPFGASLAFDLVVCLHDGRFVRVQVKAGRVRQRCVLFNTWSTDHGWGRGSYRGRADVFAVHVAELDEVFVVPVEAAATYSCSLRLQPTANNQAAGVRFAADHRLADWVARERRAVEPAAA